MPLRQISIRHSTIVAGTLLLLRLGACRNYDVNSGVERDDRGSAGHSAGGDRLQMAGMSGRADVEGGREHGIEESGGRGLGGSLSGVESDAGDAGRQAGAAGEPVADGGGGVGGVPTAGGAGEAGEVAGFGGAADSSQLVPSNIAGLALWLEATNSLCERDGMDEVSRCFDQSGHSNNATQSDSAQQPTFITTTPTGHPSLRFDDDPSTLLVANSDSLHFGEGDFTYLAVARWSNEEALDLPSYGGYGILLAKQYKWGPRYEGLALYANYPAGGQPSMRRFAAQLEAVENVVLSASNHLNDDVFRLYVARRVGADLQLYIDGASEGHTVITGVVNADALNEALNIGGYPGNPLRGDISELVVIGGSLTDAQLAALQRGLIAKYQL
jgi:hypothetical protein